MTEEELQELLAEYGGEQGGPGKARHMDPAYKPKITTHPWPGSSASVEIDNPTPPNWVILTADGTQVTVQPQPDGTYTPIKVPKAPPARAQAPATVGPAGGRYWDPNATNAQGGKGTWVDIPPTPGYSRGSTAPVQVGPAGTRIVDAQGNVISNVPPTPGYIDQQAAAEAAQADERARGWANFYRQQFADNVSQAVAQGTLSETQATNLWSRMSDVFVNWPKAVGAEARAAEATRQQGASNAGRYGLDVAGEARAQGQNTVEDTKYLAEHAVGTGPGGFLTDLPDLEGARRRAAAAVYDRMPDYTALLAQQPQTPYYGPEDLDRTRALAMPYVFGGGK
jgi:hypothetical protein